MRINDFRPTCNGRRENLTASLRLTPIIRARDFKRVSQRRPVYSIRISADPALGVLRGGDIVWFWVGPHHEYTRILRRI